MADVRRGAYCEWCGGSHRSHLRQRLSWAIRTTRHAEPKTAAARVRLLWHDLIIHGLLERGGERCQDCGRGYERWAADDAEWQRVMGWPSGLLCARCFQGRGGRTLTA